MICISVLCDQYIHIFFSLFLPHSSLVLNIYCNGMQGKLYFVSTVSCRWAMRENLRFTFYTS